MADSPDEFAADLTAAAVKAVAETTRVVKRGAQNVKNEAQRNVLQSAPTRHAHAHKAITYDDPSLGTHFGGYVVESEIGYDKDRRGGALGNLLEFGGGGDRSPAHRDLGRALDAEEPRFEKALADVVDGLL
jgi:hypothetical protein